MRLLVIGGAVSGMAAARLGARLGHSVTVYDQMPEAAGSILAEGFAAVTGPWGDDLLAGVDLVVTSPGVPERAAPIVDTLEAGIPLLSEVEFASRHLDAPLVAVTGTNGKTTVTSTIAAMLSASGLRSIAAGNIGTALSDVAGGTWDSVVVEVSSFQLRFVEAFHPHVAVVLNVVPDHLDWHGTPQAYVAAKARILERLTLDDVVIYDADDPEACRLVRDVPARAIPVSGRRVPEGGAGVTEGKLCALGTCVPVSEIGVDDPAYLMDLVASATAALSMGALPGAVREVLRRFSPGPHRRTVVGMWNDVRWVDDSKATNPHAAIAAAKAYPSVVLIAGGRNKGLDLSPIPAVDTVRALVLIGEAAPELARAAGVKPHVTVTTMQEAVAEADRLARPGDTVLLAPGCASFDMFSSYAERGERFTESVEERKGRRP